MKIETLEISGISRIKNTLNLKFNSGLNIICGANGTGKTTILDCIANFFSSYTQGYSIKRNALVDEGTCILKIVDKEPITISISDFAPRGDDSKFDGVRGDLIKKLLHIKTYRGFGHTNLSAIPKDTKKASSAYAQDNLFGINFEGTKGWFTNRYVFSPIEGNSVSKVQIKNFETAKNCFSTFSDEIAFSHVDASTLDIMIKTPQGTIYFEYLSAGLKSCMFILLGIIKEIEFRFENTEAKEFDGIILIDEIDLHLHPTWQTIIIQKLKETFPNAQIIVTTHSPHVIQEANPNEVIPLVFDENGDLYVNDIETGEFGFQGWTVDEILMDVMGMEAVRSNAYTTAMSNFDKALSTDDDKGATENYNLLCKMLHLSNPLKNILDIRMAGVKKS